MPDAKSPRQFAITPQTILVTLLIVCSFLIGSLYTKVKYLEKGATTSGTQQAAQTGQAAAAAPSKYKSFEEAMKALAKETGVDGNKLVSCINSNEKQPTVAADASQGETLGVSGTPAFFINGRLLSGAYPFEEFKKIIDEELSGKADATVTRATVNIGNAPSKGPVGAPITLVEFSDFECPFCARAFPTVQQILREYDGKVLFVYKHFPLSSIHPKAQKAAEASECARDQGKFFEFHDKLFEVQPDWVNT